jgi:hypothetical protein
MNTLHDMQLSVPYLKDINAGVRMEDVSLALDKTERYIIQRSPWPEFAYTPQVSFSIAHAGDRILLKYFVQEKAMRITHHTDNSPVYEDSCVEFFIAFGNNEEYYNLEFNGEGICLLGFGKNRSDRKPVGQDIIRRIRRLAIIKNDPAGTINWQLALVIPVGIFIYHGIDSLKKMHCKVNFYKCGDKLPEPHFLSWRDIRAAVPDFHLPEFFGDAYFE